MPTGDTGQDRRIPTEAQRAARELRRAERFAKRGQVNEAIASLQQALQFGADRYTCYLQLARLYQAQGQWPEAVSAAEKAIAADPRQVPARETIIALYLEARNYERAIAASQELLKISPRHLPARDALGAAYIGVGDVDAAARVTNELIRLEPNNAAHHFTKALLCQHRGEVRMAVEEFCRVLDMAEGTELAACAREHLDAIDAFQINQILALAMDDPLFRLRVLQNPEQAIVERGFFLSESGQQILHTLAAQELAELTTECKTRLYH